MPPKSRHAGSEGTDTNCTEIDRGTQNRNRSPQAGLTGTRAETASVILFRAVNDPPGNYTFTKDGLGRTREAEGWLKRRLGRRLPANKSLHDQVTEGVEGMHAAHLIPDVHMGPDIADNLVSASSRHNTSYIESVENAIDRHLAQGDVYLKVTVEYQGNSTVPTGVRHEFFRRESGGGLRKIDGGDVYTNLEGVPGKPMSGAIDPYTGKKIAPKDLLDPTDKQGMGPEGPY